MPSIRVLISESHDPYFNLAVEDAIFGAMPTTQNVLYLWRNAETVVIGKGQNPWKECNTRQMELDGVKLARRQTGGGAVFHDLGNSNFTFMAGKPGYDKTISTQIVLNAMKEVGINGIATGRNDLVVETDDGERKFSGSAYRESQDRGFHHGTLLLRANLARLANYLNPDAKKLQTKGISSIRSRVVNLNEIVPDIDHAMICDAIQHSFFEHYQDTVKPELISPDAMLDLPGFRETFERHQDWDWNFGKSPDFSHELTERFEWGRVDVHLDVHRGGIRDAKIYSDSLFLSPLESLAKALIGCDYQLDAIDMVISKVTTEFPSHSECLVELNAWLKDQIK